MNKISFLEMLLSAVALLSLRFLPAVFSRSLGAKSGVIVASSGTDEVVKAVASSDPARGTLAQIAAEALAATETECSVVINLGTRKAVVIEGAPGGLDAAILGAAGVNADLLATIVKDDATKSSSPMTGEGEDTGRNSEIAILALLEEAKPAMSVPSLVSKIEDACTVEDEPDGAIVVIDQVTENVRVFHIKAGRADDIDTAVLALGAEKAVFDQTVEVAGAASEKQFGE